MVVISYQQNLEVDESVSISSRVSCCKDGNYCRDIVVLLEGVGAAADLSVSSSAHL